MVVVLPSSNICISCSSLLKGYIELEKLRYDERLKVHKVEQITYQTMVPPLLYLTLVENAFKHGAGKVPGIAEINIRVETD